MRVITSASDPLDFCRKHAPTEEQAVIRFTGLGDGPDGRGNCFAYDSDHPDYSGDRYTCEVCRRRLTDND